MIAWLAASVAGDPPSDMALAAADAAVKIVLAIPLGVLVTLRWPALPPAAVIVAGMCLSAAAETVQLLFLDERAAQLTDVAANTLGTTVGVLVAVVARRDRPDA